MKTLLLMRHAKSSWKLPEIADHERPLNKRGYRDAPLMGQFLQEHDLEPQQILSSTATRARQTAELVAEASHFQGDIIYMSRLYMAEAEEYLNALRELPDQFDRVMVIGHNPGLETLLQVLSSEIKSLPTAVVAQIDLPIEKWGELNGQTNGELIEVWIPKEVQEEEEEKEKVKAKAKEKSKEKSKKKDK